uniref:Tetraspanin n=1 Tax=Globodera pallida TaxID=36090 RepID=A0A183C9B6_GLOPA
MFLLHRRMLLLLPLFALCFAAPSFKFGTFVNHARIFDLGRKFAALLELICGDSEVGGNGSDSTNNGTAVDQCSVFCKKGAFRIGCVLAVVFMLLVVILLLFVLDRLYRRHVNGHIYISA